jgi:thermitase
MAGSALMKPFLLCRKMPMSGSNTVDQKMLFKITSIIYMILMLFCSSSMAYELTIYNDKVTLHADQVKLQMLMKDLVQKADIEVYIDPDLNPYISADFINKDLQSALDSNLKSLNHALKWEAAPASSRTRIRLAEIHIFKDGSKDQTLPVKKASTLDIARNPKDGSFYVKGEMLIRLKPGVDVEYLNKILKQLDGTLLSENSTLGIYRIKLPDQAMIPELVEQIKDLSSIEMAEPNYAYPIDLPYRYVPNSTIETDLVFNPMPDGSVPIAVLDSGLAPGNLPSEYVLATRDALNPDEPISDFLGHGTQMALIAAGIVTPFGVKENNDNANPIIAIRAFDENGFTSSVALMNGIDIALANGARVVSLSWGSTMKSDFINDTLEYGASKGLIIVASAGNEPTGKPVYPAAYTSVIGIGALAPDGQNWENTNYGDFVDVYLPGFADMPVGYKADPGIYAGTSISAAFAANRIAAFLSQNPKADKKEISDNLKILRLQK